MAAIRHEARGAAHEPDGGTPGCEPDRRPRVNYAPLWCNMVKTHEDTMGRQSSGKKETHAKTRMSVSLPSALHLELERIARDKKVSLAWVMREAAEKYVADQWPLLPKAK
jgi:hypothetical protein